MEKYVETHRPVQLYVESHAGQVTVSTEDTTSSSVTASGDRADEVRVEHEGDRLRVIAPRPRFAPFRGDGDLDLRVVVPHDSTLSLRTGSADAEGRGRLASADLKSGSGSLRIAEVTGALSAETGSGDVALDRVGGEVSFRSGSGDLAAESLAGGGSFSTGSGDLTLGVVEAPVRVKTGSGDLVVSRSTSDVVITTGSGGAHVRRIDRGRVQFKSGSGDLRVGIPAGVPVWTDLSSASGDVRTDLTSVGEPAPGQDHVEVRAITHSGDVLLSEVAPAATT